MEPDQPEMHCVTDPVGKPVEKVSKADKKDKVPRPGVEKADARNKMYRLGHSEIEYGF